MTELLSIKDLHVSFTTDDGVVQAVRGIDLTLGEGEFAAIVGESGSGKSVSALSVLRLHSPQRTQMSGTINWRGEDLLSASDQRIREIRGAEIAMVFQDPLTALNPVHKVGKQISEVLLAHNICNKKEAANRAIEMLDQVGIPHAKSRAQDYPHQFSGGMRQRAMIAMALSCHPQLIIADEPTTALDVTVQAQVIELLVSRAHEAGAAVLLITHDLGVVAGTADQVHVMYAGKIVEGGSAHEVFESPNHPYTIGLLNSLPDITGDTSKPLVPIGGQPPSMLRPPQGCAFHPRCPIASEPHGCTSIAPTLTGQIHPAACHRLDVASDLRSLKV